MTAHFVDALPLLKTSTAAENDWSQLDMTLCNRYPTVIGSNKIGSELTFRFEGTTLGLYFMMASDSGDIDYRIDNGEWKHLSTWDEYCLRFNRAQFQFLARDLNEGKHTLILRVSAEKNALSTGHWVRISAFGVC